MEAIGLAIAALIPLAATKVGRAQAGVDDYVVSGISEWCELIGCLGVDGQNFLAKLTLFLRFSRENWFAVCYGQDIDLHQPQGWFPGSGNPRESLM